MVSVPIVPPKILETLKAPGEADGTTLVEQAGALMCPQTGARYDCSEGIARLLPGGGTAGAASPSADSYAGLEEFGELVTKGYRDPYLRGLLKAIGANKRVLDCGCSNGQRANFLQLNNNQVLGIDLGLADLRQAVQHKQHNQLLRVAFAQMDPLDPAVKDDSMDVVVARHVLAAASDPTTALRRLTGKVRHGGLIVVGLHNSFVPGGAGRRFSLDAVLGWFAAAGIDFVACRPAILETDGEDGGAFVPTSTGSRYARLVTQIGWFFTNRADAGTFDVMGRRR